MKKHILLLPILAFSLLPSCNQEAENVISICCSETPHARILSNAVKPLLEKDGYTLKITTADWSHQNDDVKNGKYDFNFFQHRLFLQEYETGIPEFNEDYTYKTVFPLASVHYEPLRIYYGKSSAEDFESKKMTASYVICSDPANAVRALDFLVSLDIIDSYEKDEHGNPTQLPENITAVPENEIVEQKNNFDYAIIPCSTAFDAQLLANESLPVEAMDVAFTKANVIAASVKRFHKEKAYRFKAEALVRAILDESVATYINHTWHGFAVPKQVSYLNQTELYYLDEAA